LLGQPAFGVSAQFIMEMTMQCPHGNAAFLRECRDGPVGLPREFGPVLNLMQSAVHRVLFLLKHFQAILN